MPNWAARPPWRVDFSACPDRWAFWPTRGSNPNRAAATRARRHRNTDGHMTESELRPIHVAATLALSAAGAGLFWVLGFPAAMLTGPAAVVSVATVFGFPAHIPNLLRDACFLMIGVSIGSTVTPDVIEAAVTWPLSFVVLTISLVATMAVGQAVLVRGFGYDRITALLGAAPGHLSYVLGLSADLGADVVRVALVQSVRVLLLTLLVPVLISLWGVEGTAFLAEQETGSLLALAVIFAVALATGLLFKRWNMPAALLLGAMTVSAIAHGGALTTGTAPTWLTTAAFVCMGSLIGTRFSGVTFLQLRSAVVAGVFTTVFACAIAALGAWFAAALVGLSPAALLLAFAPGGVEVMAALAVKTGLEPALVAAHHVFRLVILSVLLPVFLMRYRQRH